ncbi:unnamed protein product [Lota lota]
MKVISQRKVEGCATHYTPNCSSWLLISDPHPCSYTDLANGPRSFISTSALNPTQHRPLWPYQTFIQSNPPLGLQNPPLGLQNPPLEPRPELLRQRGSEDGWTQFRENRENPA